MQERVIVLLEAIGAVLSARDGVRTQIADDVVDGAAYAAHEFCFRVRRMLQMHATQCAGTVRL